MALSGQWDRGGWHDPSDLLRSQAGLRVNPAVPGHNAFPGSSQRNINPPQRKVKWRGNDKFWAIFSPALASSLIILLLAVKIFWER